MKRHSDLKRRLLNVILFTFFAIYSNPTFATPSLTHPLTGDIVTASTSLNLAYSGVTSPNANSITVVFTGAQTRTIHLNDSATSLSCLGINPSQSIVGQCASISSVTEGTTIPDGSYSVQVSYLSGGSTITSAAATNVVIKTATLTPTLTFPVTSAYTGTLPIQFTLPETPAASSVTLTFTNVSNNNVITLNLRTSSSGQSTFNLDLTADPGTNGSVQAASASSIPDGTYTVRLSYQDVLNNPSSSVTVANVALQAQASITSSVAAAAAGSGGGCGMIQDVKKRQYGSKNAFFESFLWMMICALAVLILRKKQVFYKTV